MHPKAQLIRPLLDVADEDNEVGFSEGDRLCNIQFTDDAWWTGTNPKTGVTGLFPSVSPRGATVLFAHAIHRTMLSLKLSILIRHTTDFRRAQMAVYRVHKQCTNRITSHITSTSPRSRVESDQTTTSLFVAFVALASVPRRSLHSSFYTE